LAAQAQTFSAPVQLGPPAAFAPDAVVGMTGGGMALAVWKSGSFTTNWSMHAPGGAWTAPDIVRIGGGEDLHLHLTGSATDGNGVLASILHSGSVQATEWLGGQFRRWGRTQIVGQGSG